MAEPRLHILRNKRCQKQPIGTSRSATMNYYLIESGIVRKGLSALLEMARNIRMK